jgi:hypothetical protein
LKDSHVPVGEDKATFGAL